MQFLATQQVIWCFLLVFLTFTKSNTTTKYSSPGKESESVGVGVDFCESPECIFYDRVFLEESKAPRTTKSGPDLIRGNGFGLEEHLLTSEDGYILKIFRIPRGRATTPENNKGHRIPVVCHHGFIADAFEWILNSVDKALGYRLADSGYDVWLINNRGTYYSLGHTKISWRRQKYWDFGFEEISIYDVPMIIDYILKETNHTQLYYVGHSMGSSCFFAAMSMFPEYNSKIKAFVGLAPAAYVGNASAPFAPIRPILLDQQGIHDDFFQGPLTSPDFLPFMEIMGHLCSSQLISRKICFAALEMIFGFDFIENLYDLRDEIVSIGVSSTSKKIFFHLMQLWKSGKFQRYDYLQKNVKIYGQRSPPLYDLSKVTAPVYIYCGTQDYFASCKDVRHLSISLPNVQEFHKIDGFNHLDFLFSSKINPLLNDRLIEIFNSLSDI